LIRLGRFRFLVGGVVLYALGVVMAGYMGATINWQVAIWGQIIVTATQLMTHYSNDYYDFEADHCNRTPTPWSGGSRVLQSGALPRQTALIAALILASVAVIGVLLLAWRYRPGPLAVPIVLAAVALAWQYSAPPLKLHARGIGEICSMFIVAGLTPLLGFYLQTGQITAFPMHALVPLCCLQFSMLVSVDIPDADGDAAADKRTLVVRLGRRASARVYVVLLALAYGLVILMMLAGLPAIVAVCFCLTLPLALWLAWRVRKGDWSQAATWGRLAFFSIALLMSAAVLEAVGFVLLAMAR